MLSSMGTPVEQALEVLRAKFGEKWEIWTVPQYTGGWCWCARLHDDHHVVHNAQEPGHLAEYMAGAWPE
jgi:hypothetical protein